MTEFVRDKRENPTFSQMAIISGGGWCSGRFIMNVKIYNLCDF